MSLTARLILKALETGIVPEKCARFWVNRMCSQAVERASLGEVEARHAVFRQICKEVKLGTSVLHKIDADDSFAELGSDFYQLFLGPRQAETCCYFPTGAESLEEAEETMLWMSADRANIRDGMRILELGCGWGAMTFWLARQFPASEIVAVTESTSRSIVLQKKLKELGINNVKILTSEFAELSFGQEFDRIISIERFDMLCPHYDWEDKLNSWLQDGGKFFLQYQVSANASYYTDSVGLESFPANFIQNLRLVLSSETLMMFQRRFFIEDYWRVSGEHYQRTAEKWLEKFYANRMDILPVLEKVYGKKKAWGWLQRWKLFLLSVSEKAGFNRGQEWVLAQMLFSKRK